MGAEGRSGVIDRALIRVQVPLRGGQRSVSGDLAQDVRQNTRVGEPRQAGVP